MLNSSNLFNREEAKWLDKVTRELLEDKAPMNAGVTQ
jgi:hypothetical protein